MGEVGVDDVSAITSWLADHAFDQVVIRESDSFGDRYEDWQRGSVVIRTVRDRGQWFILVHHTDWEDWFDIDLVTYVCEFKEDAALDRVRAVSDREIGHLLRALRSARAEIGRHALGVPRRHGRPDRRT